MTTCQNDTRLQPDLSSKKESISSKDGLTNCRHYKNRFKKRKKKQNIARNIKFSIWGFFIKSDQIHCKLQKVEHGEQSMGSTGKTTRKYCNYQNIKESSNFKQLIRFHKTVEWKIIEETPTSSNIEGNKNHEMSLVDQLSNLSLYKDEIKTHKTLLRTKKKRKTLS